jgi:hypothetical protein
MILDDLILVIWALEDNLLILFYRFIRGLAKRAANQIIPTIFAMSFQMRAPNPIGYIGQQDNLLA